MSGLPSDRFAQEENNPRGGLAGDLPAVSSILIAKFRLLYFSFETFLIRSCKS